ncbi:MAG: tetratricopeptide repeat protein [Cyanobacteria bacterium HKST-UBA01]|nr:tetratricopeptide repeat protein [Cyanobacteria bacterium HKST-UBA01]
MQTNEKYPTRRRVQSPGSGIGFWASLGFLAWLLAGALISRVFVTGDLCTQVLVFCFGFIWAIFGPFSLSFFLSEAAGRALYEGDFKLAYKIASLGVAVDRAVLPLVNLFGIYDTPLAVINLLNLANSQLLLSRFKEATENLEESLDKSQGTFGWDNHLTRLITGFLATSYLYLSRFIEAESFYSKTIAGNTRLLEELKEQEEEPAQFEVVSTLASLSQDRYGLARVKEIRGLLDEAEAIYRSAIETIFDNTEYDTDMLANHMIALGTLLIDRGSLEEAESLIERGHEIRKEIFSERHYIVSGSFLALGKLRLAQGRLSEAGELLKKALSIREDFELKRHPEGAEAICALGELAFARGENEEAEAMFKQAIEIYEETVGENFCDIALVLTPYIKLLQKEKREDESLALQARLTFIRSLYRKSS